MKTIIANSLFHPDSDYGVTEERLNFPPHWFWILLLLVGIGSLAEAGPRIPGTDASSKLEAAGTVLRLTDTFLFVWGARLFSGLCILSAGYNLKEQRFPVAIICMIAAVILGTAPVWVENIFSIGGGNGIFQ